MVTNVLQRRITETFIESNGHRLTMDDEEMVRLFLDIAGGLLSRDEIERLLRVSTHKAE
jgi:prophage maintenance system killer protein